MRIFFALDTFFVADQCVLESAYKTYSQVVGKAARLPGVDVLFICSEPVEVDSEVMKKDLITQFRVERPNEDFESLRLYLCEAIVSAEQELFTKAEAPLASFFLMDEEYAKADVFPSSVGVRELISSPVSTGK